MTTTAIRKKVHKYIDEADSDLLQTVLQFLEVYRENSESALSLEQQKEVIRRSNLYKQGKMKSYTVAEVKAKLKRNLKR